MKQQTVISVLFLFIILAVSCHHNRLKTNEEELINKIHIEEKEKKDVLKTLYEKYTTDTLNRFPTGIRYPENRKVDQENPPIVIDIAGNLNNVREVKLTNVASDITYIRMEPVPDPKIPKDLKFTYYLLDNYIVARNLYGIHLYSKDGKYVRSVVKNELNGVQVMKDHVTFWFDYTLKGSLSTVWGNGNKLFYKYTDNIAGLSYIMEYDCTSDQLESYNRPDPEKPSPISGLGEVAADLNQGNTIPPEPRKHQGMFGGPADGLFNNKDVFLLDKSSYAVPIRKGDNLMATVSLQGDTLATFTRFERLKNFTKSVMRGTDEGTQYELNNKLFIRPEFNDTVFCLIPPNRLIPVYVLRLGNYKVTRQQGVDPDFKLNGKIIPGTWAETKKYIFLTFTKDDYDCPNTRKNKTVKIYHALYSKVNKQLIIIKGDPYNYSPEILENNIDGGMPVWPLTNMTGTNGEILIPLKGSALKERVRSEEFLNATAPEIRKKALEKLATSVAENDDILMLIK